MNPEKFERIDNSIEDMSIYSDFLITTNHPCPHFTYSRHDILGGPKHSVFHITMKMHIANAMRLDFLLKMF